MRGYRGVVGETFEVIAEALAPYVDRQMAAHLGENEWIHEAANKLGKRRDHVVSLSDPQFQLEVMTRFWGPVFSDGLPADSRNRINELLDARNHWAHISDTQPMDLEYAQRVLFLAREMLHDVGSELDDRLDGLERDVRRMQLRDLTNDEDTLPSEALLLRLEALEQERVVLREEVERAKAVASSQSGRTRAVARQLAELQTQYAQVAGLQEEYELVQERLEQTEAASEAELSGARSAVESLRDEAFDLELQLADAREAMADPAMTEAGQRWMWLTAALLVMLSLLMVMLAL